MVLFAESRLFNLDRFDYLYIESPDEGTWSIKGVGENIVPITACPTEEYAKGVLNEIATAYKLEKSAIRLKEVRAAVEAAIEAKNK